ncbi:MAG: dTDP-4-dehydrorhamnose reductase [Bradyrhizobium sp.]|nr:dTDP-4-dehydrorhamnose reductase [Bradyrhizobium sp.]
MRIVVTGLEGQVARALAERGDQRGHDIVRLGRPALDLAGTRAAIGAALVAARPELIVSAAAYTAVDKAESERDLAFAVNASGAEAVALAARDIGVPLVHLSTDYVFDGLKRDPYVETDATGPRSVYGASKLAGERLVLAAQPDSAILRTAWIFSPFGNNFVRTMLRFAESRDEVGVVHDQRGGPTSALDIADAVLDVGAHLVADRQPHLRGVFHLTNAGDASWAEFAELVFRASAVRGGPAARVRRIATADYPTAAPRPSNSRLDCALIEECHGVRLRDWHDAVDAVVGRLVIPSETMTGA